MDGSPRTLTLKLRLKLKRGVSPLILNVTKLNMQIVEVIDGV